MTDSAPIIRDNIELLRQCSNMLEQIAPAAYTQNHPTLYPSGVGPHLRHCLDHYDNFLDGWAARQIDYDARQRDVSTETERSVGLARISAICEALTQIDVQLLDVPVQAKMDCGSDDPVAWSQSTPRRELQFLISHTVHHYALMAMILRHQGEDMPTDFGVAPSTLRYRQALT